MKFRRGGAGHACVKAALESGITTFGTADVYANTAAEAVLGGALKGERRESLEIVTKVCRSGQLERVQAERVRAVLRTPAPSRSTIHTEDAATA
ncbi:Aldo/keto reductase family protein [Lentzea xinjiangensis]|uniref:Aldo/keto reductase family protein n=1 Tax=Lentzea xinjiangensis TaxID=402600 RepID=A0A1H9HXG0_9PSEU|nr:Aldo/keto reductase family protein [Lentzea xinjiangensis]